jgi:predicted lactoylglutathione lyase
MACPLLPPALPPGTKRLAARLKKPSHFPRGGSALSRSWPPRPEPGRLGVTVEPRVSLVTLGVLDYGRAKAFYEALGWSATLDIQETAFFQANGCILVLWARDKLAEDSGISDDGARWGGIALAHNVGSRDEVHEIIDQARSNGAEITREPSETFYGGYAGVFLDLDGHPWEVAHNPGFGLDDQGNVVLPAT